MKPVHLEPNQLHRFYRGGARIAALRNSDNNDAYAPEEWIAATTSPFGEPGTGISMLPNGKPLPDALRADPEAYLGPAHVESRGPDVAVLIKLLDAGERLPVHFHPDDAFASEHLRSPHGKTEAWIILEADPDATVHVGFKEPVDVDDIHDWMNRQDVAAMMESLAPLNVSPGDTVFVPAGTPHAIGQGILLAELQQPTDFSVLLEWEGFAIDGPNAGHLGLGFDLALKGLDFGPWGDAEIARFTSGRPGDGRAGMETLFPAEADRFFRAERINPAPTTLEPAFSVLLVTAGAGQLSGDGWALQLSRGDAILIPFAAGECVLDGDAAVLRCMPPRTNSVR